MYNNKMKLSDENNELQQKLDVAIKALEFYANISPDEPSAALSVDKFNKAKEALRIIKGQQQNDN